MHNLMAKSTSIDKYSIQNILNKNLLTKKLKLQSISNI